MLEVDREVDAAGGVGRDELFGMEDELAAVARRDRPSGRQLDPVGQRRGRAVLAGGDDDLERDAAGLKTGGQGVAAGGGLAKHDARLRRRRAAKEWDARPVVPAGFKSRSTWPMLEARSSQ